MKHAGEEEEEKKISKKRFFENPNQHRKEINEEVPEITEPSLPDFESLVKKYDRLKQELEEEKKIEKELNSELKECRSKLNIIEVRQKIDQPSQPKSQDHHQKPPLEPRKAPNKYQALPLKKERSHSQSTIPNIQKFKNPGPFKGRAPAFDDQNIDLDKMTYEDILALEERIGNVSKGIGTENLVFIPDIIYNSIEFPKDKEARCCICLKDYEDGDIIKNLFCGHLFHMVCLGEWLENEHNCPFCKQNVF